MKGDFVTKKKLALEAIDIEQNKIGESVGSQDQVAASFGGLNLIEFEKDERITVSPLTISQKRVQQLQDSTFYFSLDYQELLPKLLKLRFERLETKLKN